MSEYEATLLVHLLGVLSFFAGIVLAGVAFEAARRRDAPVEIAAILSLARYGAMFVGSGAIVILAAGFRLKSIGHWSLDGGWLLWSLVLFVAATFLGTFGGRTPRLAREHAQRLAADGAPMDDELRRLLDEPASRAMNALSFVAVLAILVLMVAKP